MNDTRQSVIDRLHNIIENQLGVEPEKIKPEAAFKEDLNADSLDAIELVIACEEEFGLEQISDEDAEKLQTVKEAVDYLCGRLDVK